jgi:hypothetical protein
MRGGPAAGVSGTVMARLRIEALYDKIRADFPPSLTAGDDELLRQACLLLSKAQSPRVDADTAVRCAGTGHRILASLRRRYKSVPVARAGPSLAEYLDQLAEQERSAAAAEMGPQGLTGNAE